MADMSIAVLVGRLTRDAELKYTSSGLAICKFGLAVSVRQKKGDQWVDEPNFYNVVVWGKDGERLNQYLTKGKLVAVEGNLRQDKWEQDGVQRMAVEVSANSVALLGSGSGGAREASSGERDGGERSGGYDAGSRGSESRGGEARQAPARSAPPPRQAPPQDDFPDDIPF